MLESASEPNDEVVEPEVPAGAEGEAAHEAQLPSHAGTETLPPRKTRRQRMVERATAPLLERIKQLETGAQPGPETGADRPKPKRADFADDEAFEDALVAWGNERFAIQKALSDAQDAERRHLERNLRNYVAQMKEAKERYPDWDDLKAQFDESDIFIGAATQLAILELENGAEVTYYLMRHPAKAAELGRMPQVSAAMEVKALSLSLKTGAPGGEEYERPSRFRPKVPAPVRTVSTAGSNAAPTFADIAARPNYPGKARDLKRALAAKR